MKILRPTPQDYDELLTVWEASVRSTHHFLTEENIQFYKPLVRNQYFQAVVWGIERSVFFNGWEKWAKGFENQRV